MSDPKCVPPSESYCVEVTSPSRQQLSELLEHYQAGRLGRAEKVALSLTRKFPNHQFGWKVLGAVFGQTGRRNKALNANQKAVVLSPQDASAHSNLGNLLQELGRLDKAEVSLRQAISLKPDYSPAYNNLGVTFREMGKLDEAKESFKRATKLTPDFALAHSNLGNTFQELGRLDEAEISLKQAIALKPDYAAVYRRLTLIKKFHKQDKIYLKMQDLYFDESISEEQLCHINFALAKVSEDMGEVEKAFKHYREGNDLRKKLLNYDISEDIAFFKQVETCFSRININSLGNEHVSNTITPIFIVGMPRSGTSLVEQIISSHSEVTGAGELSFVAQFGDSLARGLSETNTNALVSFRKNYLSKLQNFSNGNSIVIDKMPINFFYIGLLAAAFPEAKIVHVKRNSAAVCWANYKQYFVPKTLGYCYALRDIVDYYELYKNLMIFWEKSLTNRIYSLNYELLTVDQEVETRKLINYLDLEWEDKCLSPQDNNRSVATASSIQIRKKVYQGSSQQWKKYKPFLNGVFDCFDNSIEQ